jgi:natural product precursor
MKKLNKLVLHKAKIMNAPEMKHITGGYGDDDNCVVYCQPCWKNPDGEGTICASEGLCGQDSIAACEDALNKVYSGMFSGYKPNCYCG